MAETKKPERNRRKTFIGVVTSTKMTKTIIVEVQRMVRHARFGKYVRRSTKCYVHDEKEQAQTGDRVEIMETRPMSKQKRWRLIRIVETERAETPQNA